jgi:hypothetical protein
MCPQRVFFSNLNTTAMNNLKKLLKELGEQKKTLASRRTFVLEYDTMELEFISVWRDKKTVYKDADLKAIDGLLSRLENVSAEANSLISEIDSYQQTDVPTRGAAAAQSASNISNYLERMHDLMERIKTLSADCDVLINKLPSELMIGMP